MGKIDTYKLDPQVPRLTPYYGQDGVLLDQVYKCRSNQFINNFLNLFLYQCLVKILNFSLLI